MKSKTNIFVLMLLAVITCIILFPVYTVLLNSFKTRSEMLVSFLAFPKEFTFDNYIITIQKLKYVSRFFNTLIVTVLSVTGIVFFSALAGYKIARTQSRLSKVLYLLFTLSMLIPFHSIMISLTQISKIVGVRNSLWGLSIINIGLGVNLAIFLFTGFSKSIPKELEEAAAIDGCNEFQVFRYIAMPLLKPIAATVAIIDVLWIWNDLLLPLLMLTSSKDFTLVLGINQFFGLYNSDWTLALAGLILTSIPAIMFYLVFQKYIIKGIASGAVKE
ncbi:MAG: carbohydrate ABC transporter permease [Spirochaetes bacterium]|jgi:raffinose/stachyose/melibiose transport system permease protein|nr:carbohydrate ABC transporter permease [Spirochaetota bacterium]